MKCVAFLKIWWAHRCLWSTKIGMMTFNFRIPRNQLSLCSFRSLIIHKFYNLRSLEPEEWQIEWKIRVIATIALSLKLDVDLWYATTILLLKRFLSVEKVKVHQDWTSGLLDYRSMGVQITHHRKSNHQKVVSVTVRAHLNVKPCLYT